MGYLINIPVFLTLALLLPVFFVTKAIQRSGASHKYQRILVFFVMITLLSAVLAHATFALLSVSSPAFIDYTEPTTAIIAWIYSQGGQIYHTLDAPERYSLLYGPVPYVAVASMYELIGASEFAAKLTGTVALLVACAFIVLSVRRRYPKQIIPSLVALGYFALTALLFSEISFWVRGDPFIIAAASIGLFSCLVPSGPAAWLICGLALGVAGGAKATGVLYFLPYIAWFVVRDGYRAPLAIATVGAALALLPFLSTDQVSLANYISLLRSAAKHGIVIGSLTNGLLTLVFITMPVGLFVLWQLRVEGMRGWFGKYKLLAVASLVAALLVTFASAKVGAGRYHLLPFLPALSFLAAHGVMCVWNARTSGGATIYGFWMPLGALHIALLIKASINLYAGFSLLSSHAYLAAIPADLDAIIAKYPQQNIYMGYGGNQKYLHTSFRTKLVFSGYPYLLDLPAVEDFEFSGIGIPQSTIDRMLSDKTAVWLIPVGEKPFSIVSWYRRKDRTPLFNENFRDAFSKNFMKHESSHFFDIYLRAESGSDRR